jgi:hypothetical protein
MTPPASGDLHAPHDADRDEHRADVPRGELEAHERPAWRIGGQERAGEELPRAEHELRDATDEHEMQREPMSRGPAGRRTDRRHDRPREQEGDARGEERGQHVARAQRARGDRPGTAMAAA